MIPQAETATGERSPGSRLDLSYILPVRSTRPERDLDTYLAEIGLRVEVIVVDGSPKGVFDQNHRRWAELIDHHVPVDPERETTNGKVGGVLTGLRLASHEALVIADDDVRWTSELLQRAMTEIASVDVVRPQNWFAPSPWHARWDTARSLVNRAVSGDWPGTLVVRRSALLRTGGYDGDVLFENLELVRTIRASGGRERVARDLLVPRLPPSLRQFLRQRMREAYDEFARPGRLLVELSLLPAALLGRKRAIAVLGAGSVALAEVGRRRGAGRTVFPPTAALWAPAWLAERSVTSWLALASRIFLGGVRYRGRVLRRAAHSKRTLRRS